MLKSLCLLAAASVVLPAAAGEGNWPRFRGSNAAGELRGVELPESWGADSTRWNAVLAGEGNSSPVIWGGKVFVTSATDRGGRRVLQCFALGDGRELWSIEDESAAHKRHKMNSFATSTPAVDAERVYVLWGAPQSIVLVAYTHAGEEVWRADLGRYKSGHGFGVSPIVVDGKVVVGNDQPGGNSIIALDAGSGKELWTIERAAQRATYSTPCVYPHDNGGIDLMVTDWNQGVSAIDLATGKERWSVVAFDVNDKQRAIGSPVLWDDLVIGTCGFVTGKKRLVALRPAAGGGEAELVFQLDRGVPHVPTPLAHDGRLYLWSDSAMVTCVELPTGEVIYDRERVPMRGKVFSSPVAVGDKIVNFSTEGDVVVIKAGDEFEILAEGKLPEGTCATPAAADERLVVRTKAHLLVW